MIIFSLVICKAHWFRVDLDTREGERQSKRKAHVPKTQNFQRKANTALVMQLRFLLCIFNIQVWFSMP